MCQTDVRMTDRRDPANPGQLSTLFNWNPKSSIGHKGKGKYGSLPKKRKSAPMWSHTFICLSDRNAMMPPSAQERALLQIAGLGEKRITMCTDSTPQEF